MIKQNESLSRFYVAFISIIYFISSDCHIYKCYIHKKQFSC